MVSGDFRAGLEGMAVFKNATMHFVCVINQEVGFPLGLRTKPYLLGQCKCESCKKNAHDLASAILISGACTNYLRLIQGV